jgi:UDP-N-acetylmuramyl tripeptide synthase
MINITSQTADEEIMNEITQFYDNLERAKTNKDIADAIRMVVNLCKAREQIKVSELRKRLIDLKKVSDDVLIMARELHVKIKELWRSD